MNVVVVGLGGMGKTHAEAYAESEFVEKVYGTDLSPERTASRAAELGILPCSLEQALADPAIRLVSIAASNDAHVVIAEQALRAGKAVLCEKPMGQTLAEASRLMAVQEETGGFLQIGFELHYSKLYRIARQWIDEGKIGTVVNIQTRYFCSEFHGKNNWRSNSPGSFLVGEKLSHYLDLQRWYMGCEPESVYSLSAPKVVPYFRHRDNHNILTKFRNGGVASLNFIMCLAETYRKDPLVEMLQKQSDDGHFLQYHIIGTGGCIETDVFRRRIRRWKFGDSPERQTSTIVETLSYLSQEDHHWMHSTRDQNLDVAERVARNLPPGVSASDAYETMKFCFAVETSENTGKIVRMDDDIEKEKIPQ